ncbi:hypothetical protein [Mesorhizobium sp. LNHC221B00]|nr:hypothetical protein [Mesorhizobium sp. LNHC221B00]
MSSLKQGAKIIAEQLDGQKSGINIRTACSPQLVKYSADAI